MLEHQVLWGFEVLWPIAIVSVVALAHLWVGPSGFNTCEFHGKL